jgi:hypothetical protein
LHCFNAAIQTKREKQAYNKEQGIHRSRMSENGTLKRLRCGKIVLTTPPIRCGVTEGATEFGLA